MSDPTTAAAAEFLRDLSQHLTVIRDAVAARPELLRYVRLTDGPLRIPYFANEALAQVALVRLVEGGGGPAAFAAAVDQIEATRTTEPPT